MILCRNQRDKERKNAHFLSSCLDRCGGVEDHLVFVGVKPLWVDAIVVYDVAVGFSDVTSSAAEVSILGAAVHQVLRAQRHEDPRVLLHLAFQRPQRAEGPTRPTWPLIKKPWRYHVHHRAVFKWLLRLLTWFWTGLTRPFLLQSTLGGKAEPPASLKV